MRQKVGLLVTCGEKRLSTRVRVYFGPVKSTSFEWYLMKKHELLLKRPELKKSGFSAPKACASMCF
jgi:hypothetical protein